MALHGSLLHSKVKYTIKYLTHHHSSVTLRKANIFSANFTYTHVMGVPIK